LDHARRVAIGGESFSVRSDAPPETIERVAHYVDESISKARAALGETDRFRIAVLASLQVAGDLMEARQELDTARTELDELRSRLSSLNQRLLEESG
jgi:cell division protein ZapA (FtsZ GTPase activity inhibitor)